MKIYLAGQNGKRSILSLYETIFSEWNKESVSYPTKTAEQSRAEQSRAEQSRAEQSRARFTWLVKVIIKRNNF